MSTVSRTMVMDKELSTNHYLRQTLKKKILKFMRVQKFRINIMMYPTQAISPFFVIIRQYG